MKEYIYVYEDSKGELDSAVTTNMFLEILLLFWLMPLVAFCYWIWHFFSGDAKWITKEDYYAQKAEYHKKQSQIK